MPALQHRLLLTPLTRDTTSAGSTGDLGTHEGDGEQAGVTHSERRQEE